MNIHTIINTFTSQFSLCLYEKGRHLWALEKKNWYWTTKLKFLQVNYRITVTLNSHVNWMLKLTTERRRLVRMLQMGKSFFCFQIFWSPFHPRPTCFDQLWRGLLCVSAPHTHLLDTSRDHTCHSTATPPNPSSCYYSSSSHTRGQHWLRSCYAVVRTPPVEFAFLLMWDLHGSPEKFDKEHTINSVLETVYVHFDILCVGPTGRLGLTYFQTTPLVMPQLVELPLMA